MPLNILAPWLALATSYAGVLAALVVATLPTLAATRLRRRLAATPDEALARELAGARTALAAGRYAALATSSAATAALATLVARAEDEGLALSDTLAALDVALSAERRVTRGAQALVGVLAARTLLGLGLAALGRCALGGATLLDAADAAALVAAALLALAAVAVTARLVPRSWLWGGERLAPQAAAWIALHLGASPLVASPLALPTSRHAASVASLAATVDALATTELATGVSQAPARRAAAASCAAAWTEARGRRLARLRDALPLFELVGIGAPGALVLLLPAVRVLG